MKTEAHRVFATSDILLAMELVNIGAPFHIQIPSGLIKKDIATDEYVLWQRIRPLEEQSEPDIAYLTRFLGCNFYQEKSGTVFDATFELIAFMELPVSQST